MSEFTVFFHSSSGLFDKQAVELTQRGALHGRTQQTAVKFSTYWKAHRQMMLNQSRLINLSSWMIVHMDSVFRCCVYYCCVLFLYFENSYGSLWPGGKLCCYFFLFFFAPVCQLSFEFCTANMAVLLYSREHSVIKFACHASNIFFIIDQPLSFKEFFSIFCSLEVEKRSYQFQRCLTTPFDHVAVVHVCVCWVKWDLWNCMMTLVYL